MHALSLLQPWASLVAIGAKRVETRSWGTKHRGPLLIHASLGKEAMLELPPDLEELMVSYLHKAGVYGALPRGVILAVVRLADVQRIPENIALPYSERQFGDFTPGRFAWFMEELHRLPIPIPCRGSLGVWSVPADISKAVRDSLR